MEAQRRAERVLAQVVEVQALEPLLTAPGAQ